MIKRRGCARFLKETLETLLVCNEFGGQDFQRDGAREFRVMREINFAHPACAERFENPVVRDRFLNHCVAPSPNSRLYLSFCAFISAMNWMNSGDCLMRFKYG